MHKLHEALLLWKLKPLCITKNNKIFAEIKIELIVWWTLPTTLSKYLLVLPNENPQQIAIATDQSFQNCLYFYFRSFNLCFLYKPISVKMVLSRLHTNNYSNSTPLEITSYANHIPSTYHKISPQNSLKANAVYSIGIVKKTKVFGLK